MPLVLRARSSIVRARAALIVMPSQMTGRVSDPTGESARVRAKMGEKLLQLVKDAYLAKSKGWTDVTGMKWKPLSKAAARKPRQGILHVTGNLLSKFYFDPTPRGMQRGLSITIRSRAWYAMFHHAGTPTIPARPFWPARLHKAWRRELMRTVKEGASEMVKRLFGLR